MRGRASRSEFWWFALEVAALYLLAWYVDSMRQTGGALSVVAWYGSLVPLVTLTVRRLHDSGSSGYWGLVILLPLIGVYWILSMLIQPSDGGDNAFGPGPPGPVDGTGAEGDPARTAE
ncbi:MAG TPA: DUF805 domain-containing protein [Candidatus Angelobacter sp.]|nr:DUF805 domain-containing protein [Candidatus Angelobacter sp.]